MNKERKWIIPSLVILIFLGINCVGYKYFFLPRYKNLLERKEEFTSKEEKIKKLKATEKKITKTKEENEKLKKDIQLMDKLTSNQIDTPQLIYDFYYSCIKYGINGEEIKFDLLPSNDTDNEENTNKIEDKKKENIKKEDLSNSKEKSNSSEANYISDGIVRLSINLMVNGDKYKIEKYINNLNSITERKLNVKSIELSSKTEKEKNKEENNNKDINNNNINLNNSNSESNKISYQENNSMDESNNFILVKDNEICAEIVFYQYIRVNEENYDAIKNYAFYNKKTGFNSIADMFGSKKRSR